MTGVAALPNMQLRAQVRGGGCMFSLSNEKHLQCENAYPRTCDYNMQLIFRRLLDQIKALSGNIERVQRCGYRSASRLPAHPGGKLNCRTE